jgi:hypothetical protein
MDGCDDTAVRIDANQIIAASAMLMPMPNPAPAFNHGSSFPAVIKKRRGGLYIASFEKNSSGRTPTANLYI